MFKKALRKLQTVRSENNLSNYFRCKSDYKRLCKTKRLQYNREYLCKIDRSVNDARVFWRELRNLSGSNSTPREADIPLLSWYEHFSALFSADGEEDQDTNVRPTVDVPLDDIEQVVFNSPITDEEVLLAVKHININKAVGGILLPQHIVHGISILLPVIVKLFNRLFITGTFPEK